MIGDAESIALDEAEFDRHLKNLEDDGFSGQGRKRRGKGIEGYVESLPDCFVQEVTDDDFLADIRIGDAATAAKTNKLTVHKAVYTVPQNIRMKDWAMKEINKRVLLLKNTSNKHQAVVVTKPLTSRFRIEGPMDHLTPFKTLLPPGATLVYTVYFQRPQREDKDFHLWDNFRDVVMVYTRFYAIRVPLTAIKNGSTAQSRSFSPAIKALQPSPKPSDAVFTVLEREQPAEVRVRVAEPRRVIAEGSEHEEEMSSDHQDEGYNEHEASLEHDIQKARKEKVRNNYTSDNGAAEPRSRATQQRPQKRTLVPNDLIQSTRAQSAPRCETNSSAREKLTSFDSEGSAEAIIMRLRMARKGKQNQLVTQTMSAAQVKKFQSDAIKTQKDKEKEDEENFYKSILRGEAAAPKPTTQQKARQNQTLGADPSRANVSSPGPSSRHNQSSDAELGRQLHSVAMKTRPASRDARNELSLSSSIDWEAMHKQLKREAALSSRGTNHPSTADLDKHEAKLRRRRHEQSHGVAEFLQRVSGMEKHLGVLVDQGYHKMEALATLGKSQLIRMGLPREDAKVLAAAIKGLRKKPEVALTPRTLASRRDEMEFYRSLITNKEPKVVSSRKRDKGKPVSVLMPPPMTTAASKQYSKAGEANWVQKEYEERLRRAMQKEGLTKPLLGHRTAPLGAVRSSANTLVAGAGEGAGQMQDTQTTTTTRVRSRLMPTAGRLRPVNTRTSKASSDKNHTTYKPGQRIRVRPPRRR